MSAATVEKLRPVVGRMPFVALIALNRAAPGLTDREIKVAMRELGYEPAKLGRIPFYVRSDGVRPAARTLASGPTRECGESATDAS